MMAGSRRSRPRHGSDDRLDAIDLFVIELVRGRPQVLRHARHEPHDAAERAHLADLGELGQEVVEREGAAEQPFGRLLDDVGVHRALRLLDEREHVTHPKDAARHAVGVEQVEVRQALADGREDDRLADHVRTESATPPRASPSSFVTMTPSSARASWKRFAVPTASWPVIASITRNV